MEDDGCSSGRRPKPIQGGGGSGDDGDDGDGDYKTSSSAAAAAAAAADPSEPVSAAPSSNSTTTGHSSPSLSLQDQMDHVLNLLQQPVPNTRHVDEAVTTVLKTLKHQIPPTKHGGNGDDKGDNEDDDDDEVEEAEKNKKKRPLPQPEKHDEHQSQRASNDDDDDDHDERSNNKNKRRCGDLIVNNVMGNKMTDLSSSPEMMMLGRGPPPVAPAAAAGRASQQRIDTTTTTTTSHNMIRVDMGNYDDEDDDEEVTKPDPKNTLPSVADLPPPVSATTTTALNASNAIASTSPQYQPRKEEEVDRLEQISNIPMGVEAAKMMVTFGDGRKPLPDAILEALLATRRTIQLAIMDARVVRRRLQTEYVKARLTLDQYVNPTIKREHHRRLSSSTGEGGGGGGTAVGSAADGTTSTSTRGADSKIMFRALADGPDRLALTTKCGFDMEELTHLFPEEMRSYQRWNEMKDDAKDDNLTPEQEEEESSTDAASDAIGNENDDDREEEDSTTSSPRKKKKKRKKKIKDGRSKDNDSDNDEDHDDHDEPTGGHLKQRLQQFDVRTDQMTTDWYSKFSKVRQGSFLKGNVSSQNYRQRLDQEHEWEELRRNKTNGRRPKGTWENIPAKSVRFLHWLGFDPPNLCPPDDEVTGALAFLAYDRLGRIVEKAIYIRNMEELERLNKNNCGSGSGSGSSGDDDGGLQHQLPHNLWEMPPGQQLSKQDIERALQDPDVKPSGIYSCFAKEYQGSNVDGATVGDDGIADKNIGNDPILSGPSSIQLYFGEGFEDRLELEMDE